jgi:hypothetical protein
VNDRLVSEEDTYNLSEAFIVIPSVRAVVSFAAIATSKAR